IHISLIRIYRRQSVGCCEIHDLRTMGQQKAIRQYDHRIGFAGCERRECCAEIIDPADIQDRTELQSNGGCCTLSQLIEVDVAGIGGVPEYCKAGERRNGVLKKLQASAFQLWSRDGKSGDVASRPREAVDEPGVDRITA